MDAQTQELVDLVRRMRGAQRAYFAGRSPEALAAARQLEVELDRMLKRLDQAEPTLFDRSPTPYD